MGRDANTEQRKIELDRNGEVITVASFRIPRTTWERYREVVDGEDRTTSADLRRYIEGRLADSEEIAA